MSVIRNKSIVFFILLLSFSLMFFGCGGDDSSTGASPEVDTQKNGFSEYDFASDPNIRVKPENVAAIFLEPSDAVETKVPDVNGLGADFILINIEDGNYFIYSLDTRDNTIDSAVMTDSSGEEMFRLDHDSPETEIYLKPGNYTLLVNSGYTREENGGNDHRVVFLCPNMGFREPGETASTVKPKENSFKQVLRVNSAPWGNLQGINLSHACLDSADFYYANLEETNFNSASMVTANLEGVELKDAILYAAKLQEVNLHNSKMEGVDFYAADLVKGNLSASSINSAYMQSANLENINLADSSMKNTNLYAANLTNANLISADLTRANLASAQLANVNLMSACLDDAYLYGAAIEEGNLEGATLRKVNLASAYLYRANLHDADLTSANLADADFSYSVLKNAILTGAIIEGTDFTGADTTGVTW